MTMITETLSALETCYDAIPREDGALAEVLGPFVLFHRQGSGWPFYARPRLGAESVTVADVDLVRARQRLLGVPEAFEWVNEVTPQVLPAVLASGLDVIRAPLMVLGADPLPTPETFVEPGTALVHLDPDMADFRRLLALSSAVAHIGFAAPGTSQHPAGGPQRDEALADIYPTLDHATLATIAHNLRTGRKSEAVASTPDFGMAARGAVQTGAGAAEIVGVATLPVARRRGLGAGVSALLAQKARTAGYRPVFLSAASEDVARVYRRVGFHQIGTACIAQPPATPAEPTPHPTP